MKKLILNLFLKSLFFIILFPSLCWTKCPDVNDFDKTIKKDKNSSVVLIEAVEADELRPVETVNIDNNKFYFSKVIRDRTPGGYDEVVMFHCDEKTGKIQPRSLYRSNSSGFWRSTPGFDEDEEIYSKGKEIHYTQETRLVKELDQTLDLVEKKYAPIEVEGDMIESNFTIRLMKKHGHFTYDDEVEEVTHPYLEQFQDCPPGYCFREKYAKKHNIFSYGRKLSSYNFSGPAMSKFLPNFESGPIDTYYMAHTLLSTEDINGNLIQDIKVQVFEGLLKGRKVHWHFAKDITGRVWIDKIVFADSKVNSYGVKSEVINSGVLTNKPLEYIDQADGLFINKDYLYFNRKYRDITPVLKNLLPIKLFIEYEEKNEIKSFENCYERDLLNNDFKNVFDFADGVGEALQ